MFNHVDEKMADEYVFVAECRNLRKIVNILTMSPYLKKKEYIRLMFLFNQILERMEKEGQIQEE